MLLLFIIIIIIIIIIINLGRTITTAIFLMNVYSSIRHLHSTKPMLTYLEWQLLTSLFFIDYVNNFIQTSLRLLPVDDSTAFLSPLSLHNNMGTELQCFLIPPFFSKVLLKQSIHILLFMRHFICFGNVMKFNVIVASWSHGHFFVCSNISFENILLSVFRLRISFPAFAVLGRNSYVHFNVFYELNTIIHFKNTLKYVTECREYALLYTL